MPDLASGRGLLSDLPPRMKPVSVGLPPRVIDPSLVKALKQVRECGGVSRCPSSLTWAYPVVMAPPAQVDFVGHLLNPKFSRGLPVGEAARLAAPLRNQRVQLSGGSETGRAASLERERAERARKRVEQGEEGRAR